MPSFMGAHRCTKGLIGLLLIVSEVSLAQGWTVDFSRREQDLKKLQKQHITPNRGVAEAPIVAEAGATPEFLGGLFEAAGPVQEVVILNTGTGFVPATLRLEKNGRYQVRVVNINDEKKNVSFILDAFSEHHGTYFGKMKSFEMTPKTEGVFAFHCPETGAEGQIVVTDNSSGRAPASN